MIYVPAYIASVLLSWDLVARHKIVGEVTVGSVLDVAALSVIVAGVFVVARYREALAASDKAAQAWKEERDAEVAHANRLQADLADLRAKNAALSARPDLTELHREMKDLARAMRELTDGLQHPGGG